MQNTENQKCSFPSLFKIDSCHGNERQTLLLLNETFQVSHEDIKVLKDNKSTVKSLNMADRLFLVCLSFLGELQIYCLQIC